MALVHVRGGREVIEERSAIEGFLEGHGVHYRRWGTERVPAALRRSSLGDAEKARVLEFYAREIAAEKEGVEKVFAMQAGREVRVMVKPEQVDDIQAQVIARDIAKQVEEELTYPGQIRVTVVRESRATEFAR